jgi:hypothetical protein
VTGGRYVYMLRDAAGVPRYVGIGSGRRCRGSARLRSLSGKHGPLAPEIIVAGVDDDEAKRHEARLVGILGCEFDGTGPLMNRQVTRRPVWATFMLWKAVEDTCRAFGIWNHPSTKGRGRSLAVDGEALMAFIKSTPKWGSAI